DVIYKISPFLTSSLKRGSMRAFLVHSNRDNVGVAIVEIKRGQTLRGGRSRRHGQYATTYSGGGHPGRSQDRAQGFEGRRHRDEVWRGYRKSGGRYSAWRTRSRSQSKNEEVVSMQDLEFRGYRREVGRVGIRN